jgi:hypothetical protein
MAKVLAISVNKNAAIGTHVLFVSAAEVGVKEGVWQATQCLHRCLVAVASNVELDAALSLLLVHVHGLDLPRQFDPTCFDLSQRC